MMPCFPLLERREARHTGELERAGSASGRKRHPDRRVFHGILFVLHTGISGSTCRQELGVGFGTTCWRRLAEWTEAGV